MNTKNRTVPFCLIFLTLIIWFQILGFGIANAGLLGSSVPKGKEIRDPYLEKLFAPELPYESIKIIETPEGKRYVVIKTKERLTGEKRIDYEKNTLRKRGIVVYRSGSPRTDRLLVSEMRLYRVVSEEPYVVEYSEVIGKRLEEKDEVESVVIDEGKHLIVLINKEFGKVFKRVEIYPKEETKCLEPPFVGKYPNARSISCTGGEKGVLFVYVTKDKGQQVYDHYKDRLKAHYKKVGFNFPEESWKAFGALHNLGMQIKSSEVARVVIYLDPLKKGTSIAAPPPTNGIVFHIEIIQIGLIPVIKNLSLIRIFYCTNPEKINLNIERMKKLYPEG
jgi:hypothetical protein